jgi:hypothetical protein
VLIMGDSLGDIAKSWLAGNQNLIYFNLILNL